MRHRSESPLLGILAIKTKKKHLPEKGRRYTNVLKKNIFFSFQI